MTDQKTNSKHRGTQPLDGILAQLNLTGKDLVERSTEQLTFKQVNKARCGIRMTLNIQEKITNALNKCLEEAKYKRRDLFTY